jgi:hypothetical protein
MEKEINFEKTLSNYVNLENLKSYLPPTYYAILIDTVKQVCNQTVDLCLKNARIENNDNKKSQHFMTETGEHFIINKESILKTKKQII